MNCKGEAPAVWKAYSFPLTFPLLFFSFLKISLFLGVESGYTGGTDMTRKKLGHLFHL